MVLLVMQRHARIVGQVAMSTWTLHWHIRTQVRKQLASLADHFFCQVIRQMNTSNEYRERLPLFNGTHIVRPEERVQENAQLTDKSIDPQKLTGRGVSHGISTQTERTTGESSYVGPSINMRTRSTNYLRSKHVLQGSANKRLILQISATGTESINIEDKHAVNLTESKIADAVMLQTAKEIAVSDSHLDELGNFSDHVDAVSVEAKPAFQQNHEELMPAVRLRRNSQVLLVMD